jgi:protein-disulfide isomerase
MLNRIATVAVIVLASVILVQRLTAVDGGAKGTTPHALPESLWATALAASRPIGRNSDDEAALRIVEFTDFDCPACAAFHAEAFEAIQQAFWRSHSVEDRALSVDHSPESQDCRRPR